MAAALSSPSPKASVTQPAHDMQPRPTSEVLLVCVMHDSPRLRAAWDDVFVRTVEPLCHSFARLYSSSCVMMGGVIYRSRSSRDFASPLHPLESLSYIPFVPIRHFLPRVRSALYAECMYTLDQLDGAQLESPLAEALAATIDLLDRQETRPQVIPFARAAMRSKDTQVVARHLMHVVALDTNLVVTPMGQNGPHELPAFSKRLHPHLHAQSRLDMCTYSDLVHDINKRPMSFSTIVYADTAVPAETRASLTQTAHDTLCLSRSADDRVSPSDLLGAQGSIPATISAYISGAEVTRLLRKRSSPDTAPEAPNKRSRLPHTPLTPTFKMDQASFNKIIMIQQQQAKMLKNLAQYVALGQTPGSNMPSKALDQFRQRIAAQQLALKHQAERLRANKPLDLSPIIHALATITADAKEWGIHLGGSNEQAPAAPRASEETARSQLAWQGMMQWNTSSQSSPLCTLVTATCGHAQVKQNLQLPWPSMMTINGFFTIDPARLQQYFTQHRLPCALLSLCALPSSAPIQNAEYNAANYRSLATMLEQNKRAAYIQHGAPECGIVIVALSSARLPPTQAAHAPRLLAIVFHAPIPFAELGAPTTSSTSNTRGMISVPPSSSTSFPAPFMSNPFPGMAAPTAVPAMPQPMSLPLGSLSPMSAQVMGAPATAMPNSSLMTRNAAPSSMMPSFVGTQDLLSAEQLASSLGLPPM